MLAKEYTNPNPEDLAMIPGQMTYSKYHLGRPIGGSNRASIVNSPGPTKPTSLARDNALLLDDQQ